MSGLNSRNSVYSFTRRLENERKNINLVAETKIFWQQRCENWLYWKKVGGHTDTGDEC